MTANPQQAPSVPIAPAQGREASAGTAAGGSAFCSRPAQAISSPLSACAGRAPHFVAKGSWALAGQGLEPGLTALEIHAPVPFGTVDLPLRGGAFEASRDTVFDSCRSLA